MDEKKILQETIAGFKAAKAYAEPLWAKRINNLELYVGMNPKKRYKSEASFHVPYVASLLDNVWPLLTNKLPEAEVRPNNSERDRNAAKLMNELVKYTFRTNNFDLLFLNIMKESMLFGNAWAKVCWNYEDEDTDHAEIKHLNTFDVYVHPRKIKIDDRWPIYIRSEMTKPEMLEQGWDEKAIKGLGESKLEDESYRRQYAKAMGLSLPAQKDKDEDGKTEVYEVIEEWRRIAENEGEKERTSFVIVANGEAIVNPVKEEKGANRFLSPYIWKDESTGKIKGDRSPIAVLPYNPLPHAILAESFIDPVASQQVELNSLENMKADNYKRRNNPPLKVRRSANIDLQSLKFISGLPWMLEEQDDIMPFDIPDLSLAIDSQQKMIKEQMQARTGANDVLLVSDMNTIKGGDTAFGANIANENTKMRFRPQATLIDLFVELIGMLTIDRYQKPEFFDQPKAISIAADEGVFYEETIKPQDIQDSSLQFVVESGTSLAESKNSQLQKLIQLKSLYMEDQSINQTEIDKELFDAAGMDYNKVKINMQGQAQDLAMKLQQLMQIAQRPDFKSQPQSVQQNVLANIDKIKQMLQAVGGAPGQANGTGAATPGGGQPQQAQPQAAAPQPAAAPPGA